MGFKNTAPITDVRAQLLQLGVTLIAYVYLGCSGALMPQLGA